MQINNNYIISGASSSLGKVLVKKLINNHQRVFAISRSKVDEFEIIQNESFIYRSGINLENFHSNTKLISEVEQFFTGNEIKLIHTAGDLWYHYPFLDVPTEDAMRIMGSHYGSYYSTVQAILPIMIKNGGGRLLTYSCNANNEFLPHMLPFTAAKRAVDALVKCVAHEYAGKGIVSNAIAVSSLKTDKNKEIKPFGDYEHYIDLSDLADLSLEIINSKNHLMNAAIIKCYEYSDKYYYEGVLDRVKR